MKIVETKSQDINNDRLSDLVVTVSEAQELITENETQEFRCQPNIPEATLHQLTFLFNGQSFLPTGETVETIEYLKSIGLFWAILTSEKTALMRGVKLNPTKYQKDIKKISKSLSLG